jgi:hypothetical protein
MYARGCPTHETSRQACVVYFLLASICKKNNFQIRSALFCGITQRIALIPYRRLGAIYRSHLQGLRNPPFKCGYLMLYTTHMSLYRRIEHGRFIA